MFLMNFISIICNWAFKLFIAWVAYQIVTGLNFPEWAIIAIITIVALKFRLK